MHERPLSLHKVEMKVMHNWHSWFQRMIPHPRFDLDDTFKKYDCWHWITLWPFYSTCIFRNPSNSHHEPFTLQINTARKSSGDSYGGWLGRGLIKESTFWERTLGLWGWLVIRSEVKWPPRLLVGDKQAFGDVKRPEDVSLRSPTPPILPFKFAHSFNAIRLV